MASAIALMLPRGLSDEYLISLSDATYPANVAKDVARLECMLDLICRRDETAHRRNRGKCWVNLNSRILIQQLGRNALKLLNRLIEADIVECNYRHRIGEYSRSYRIAPQYLFNEHGKIIPLQMAIRQGDIYTAYRDYRWKRQASFAEDARENLRAVRFDSMAAHQHAMREFQRRYDVAENDVERRKARDWIEDIHASIQNIAHDRLWATFDAFGRLHTNYTSLWSPLRQYIKGPNGERMVSLDIKNSQPFILAVILNELANGVTTQRLNQLTSIMHHAASTGRKPIRFDEDTRSWSDDIYIPAQNSREGTWHRIQSILQDVGESLSHHKAEIASMLRTCQEGRFYDEFADTPEKKELLATNRSKFKGDVFTTLYGDPQYETAGSKLWKDRYPAIWQAIVKLKSLNYTILPKFMQAIESSAILNQPVRDAFSKRTGVLTVHDSYIVPGSTASQWQERLRTALGQEAGIERSGTVTEETHKGNERVARTWSEAYRARGDAERAADTTPEVMILTVSRVHPIRRQIRRSEHPARPPPPVMT